MAVNFDTKQPKTSFQSKFIFPINNLSFFQLYGAIIATNMNIIQVREIELMNGHVFKLERSKISSRRSMCDKCKKIIESSYCDGCRLTLCKDHWTSEKCKSDYGIRMLKELKANIVELDYSD